MSFLAELIEDAMQPGPLTLTDLARATGLSRSTLRSMSAGDVKYRTHTTVSKLVAGLGCGEALVMEALHRDMPDCY